MTQEELIKAVVARTGVSVADARAVLLAAGEAMLQELGEGDVVPLPGLGRLRPVWRGERVIRSVQDGRKLALDGQWVAQFRPARGLTDVLEARSPRLLRDPEHQRAWRLAEALAADLRSYFPDVRPNFGPDGDAAQLESACILAYGASWVRARSRFDKDVSESIRAQRDYLILAIRRRARV